MMTEDEAKTKWCPWARLITAGVGDGQRASAAAGFNRVALTDDESTHISQPPNTNCIASRCMAWRWKEEVRREADGEPVEPGRAYFRSSIVEKYVTVRGFCGLAGVP